MHTIDGGVLRVAIQLCFSVGFVKDWWKYIAELKYDEAFMNKVEEYLDEWRSNVDSEDYARQPRSLKEIGKWKMRETHTSGVILIPALHAVSDLNFNNDFFQAYMALIAGIRLVYRFTHKPLPTVCNYSQLLFNTVST